MNGLRDHHDPNYEYRSRVAVLPQAASSAKLQPVRTGAFGVSESRGLPIYEAAQWLHLVTAASVSGWFAEAAGQLSLPLLQAGQRPPLGARRRETELRWLEQHARELRAFAGEWVAIHGEELICHAPTPAGILEVARRRGFDRPLLFQVPRATESEISFAAFD